MDQKEKVCLAQDFGIQKVQAGRLWESLSRPTQIRQLAQDGTCVCIAELIGREDPRAEREDKLSYDRPPSWDPISPCGD